MVQKFLTREAKELNFSDILKEFIEITDCEYDDCSVEVAENKSYGWLDITLSSGEKEYKLTLHKDYEDKTKYSIHSLPGDYSKGNSTMKLTVDGAELEMPFTRDVLQDNFVSFVARLIIANTKITMDCKEFHENMFPQDECHC